MRNLVLISEQNIHMFPLDHESELTIKAYLDDNAVNSTSKFEYAYNPESNKIYSRHLVNNTLIEDWEEDSSIKFKNN